jgi:hypothetical protein
LATLCHIDPLFTNASLKKGGGEREKEIDAVKTLFIIGCGGGYCRTAGTWYFKMYVNLIGFEKICGFCINSLTCYYQIDGHWE